MSTQLIFPKRTIEGDFTKEQRKYATFAYQNDVNTVVDTIAALPGKIDNGEALVLAAFIGAFQNPDNKLGPLVYLWIRRGNLDIFRALMKTKIQWNNLALQAMLTHLIAEDEFYPKKTIDKALKAAGRWGGWNLTNCYVAAEFPVEEFLKAFNTNPNIDDDVKELTAVLAGFRKLNRNKL